MGIYRLDVQGTSTEPKQSLPENFDACPLKKSTASPINDECSHNIEIPICSGYM